MGYTKWSSDAYAHLRASYATKSRDDIFRANKSRRIHPTMNPHGIMVRESRDSDAHPHSMAIGVFLDVTGSMGRIPELLVRHKLSTLMDTILDHKVESPQVMFSAIGDHLSDRAPLQVGQFESGATELSNGLANLFLEGGGGGQNKESYLLAWLIAGRHTSIDCYEKRRQKGFLFTVGDERNWESLSKDHVEALMGYRPETNLEAAALLAEAQRMYHVYHIHINETHYRNNPEVIGYWRDTLGERLLILDDHNALAELIASTVAVAQGTSLDHATAAFDNKTAGIVSRALSRTRVGGAIRSQKRGIMRL
ncbi:MAG: hypothetical protein MI974_27115 [Chitinophagales bacterium]|nr:hypothetical protein [Chitinophagales bacterium]